MSAGKNNYLKSELVNDNDIVTIADQGEWVESTKYKYPDGNFKKSFEISVKKDNDIFTLRLNKFSRENLVASFGDETADWVGKEIKLVKEFQRSLNKYAIIAEAV